LTRKPVAALQASDLLCFWLSGRVSRYKNCPRPVEKFALYSRSGNSSSMLMKRLSPCAAGFKSEHVRPSRNSVPQEKPRLRGRATAAPSHYTLQRNHICPLGGMMERDFCVAFGSAAINSIRGIHASPLCPPRSVWTWFDLLCSLVQRLSNPLRCRRFAPNDSASKIELISSAWGMRQPFLPAISGQPSSAR